MTEENKTKQSRDEQRPQQPSNSQASQPAGDNEEHHALGVQAQRDEEIEEIQKRSRHQPPGIQRPPEVPPAPPRKALTIVGVLLVVLLIAGAFTMFATNEPRAGAGQ